MNRGYLLGLIGDGIDASLTPPMHEAEAAEHGLRLIYRTIDLTRLGRDAQAVGELLRHGAELGYDAFNITHPCKQVVLRYLDEVAPEAERIGAVNTVLIRDGRFVGSNTDAIGFARGLAHAVPGADLGHVVQIGAGGAGAAITHALAGMGATRITVVDLDAKRAGELAERVGGREGACAVATATPDDVPALLPEATGLVNASPIGMHHHPGCPVPVEALHPGLWVADAVYRPTVTELVSTARRLGCRTMEGGHMAVGQAAATFEQVTGRSADVERMRGVFTELVAAEDAAVHDAVQDAAAQERTASAQGGQA